MRIELNHTLPADCSAELIEARMQSALNVSSTRIERLRVTTGDLNAEKGGTDKICRVTVHLSDGAVLTVSDRRPDLSAAVTWAASKMAEVVRRRAERQNRRRRSRLSYGGTPDEFAAGGNFDDSGDSARDDGPAV